MKYARVPLPPGRYTAHMPVLPHDAFFGNLQFSRLVSGITLSHRIATSSPRQLPIHTHTDAHFVLVTAGHYVSSATGDPNPRTSLIYNPPGTTHRDHFWQGAGSFFTASLSSTKLSQLLDPARCLSQAAHIQQERACGLARALLMECARWNENSRLRAESLCVELLAETSENPPSFRSSPPSWLVTACEMIQDRPEKVPSVNGLARAAGVHAVHLARAFRVFLGCTPGDLLRLRRLEIAASALLQQESSLTEIALASGFSDQAQFTKAFRRTYGLSPGAYRRSCRSVPRRPMLHFDKT